MDERIVATVKSDVWSNVEVAATHSALIPEAEAMFLSVGRRNCLDWLSQILRKMSWLGVGTELSQSQRAEVRACLESLVRSRSTLTVLALWVSPSGSLDLPCCIG